MGAMNDAVQNGIADGRIADEFVPAGYRDLAGHQQGSFLVAVFDDLQQVAALLAGQRLGAQ
jgi:hypothetical protein